MLHSRGHEECCNGRARTAGRRPFSWVLDRRLSWRRASDARAALAYMSLSTWVGSRREARCAGSHPAMAPMTARVAAAAARVAGSPGSRPYNNDATNREAHDAIASPTTIPTPTSRVTRASRDASAPVAPPRREPHRGSCQPRQGRRRRAAPRRVAASARSRPTIHFTIDARRCQRIMRPPARW